MGSSSVKGDRINAFVVKAYGAATLYLREIEILQLRCIRGCSLRGVECGTGVGTLPFVRNFVAEITIFVRVTLSGVAYRRI